MKRILFRGDAAPAIGTGDLASLIHFSRFLEQTGRGWESHFLIREYRAARELASAHGLGRLAAIDPEATPGEDLAAVCRYAEENRIDAVCFQITGWDLGGLDISGIDAARCVVDFYGRLPRGADLVVNWDTGAEARYPARDAAIRYFLGPEYVFLPPEVAAGGTAVVRNHPPRRVLVAMGGGDEHDVTQRVLLDILPTLPAEVAVIAVVGAGYRFRDRLLEAIAPFGDRVVLRGNVRDMAEIYRTVDYAFGAGGLTAFELVASGIPCSLIACYEHQIERCRYFAAQGWATFLGFREGLAPIRLPDGVTVAGSGSRFSCRLGEVASALEELTAGRPAEWREE